MWKKRSSSQRFPLISTYMLWYMHAHTHTYTCAHIIHKIKKSNLFVRYCRCMAAVGEHAMHFGPACTNTVETSSSTQIPWKPSPIIPTCRCLQHPPMYLSQGWLLQPMVYCKVMYHFQNWNTKTRVCSLSPSPSSSPSLSPPDRDSSLNSLCTYRGIRIFRQPNRQGLEKTYVLVKSSKDSLQHWIDPCQSRPTALTK